jgi:hypothetical protein
MDFTLAQALSDSSVRYVAPQIRVGVTSGGIPSSAVEPSDGPCSCCNCCLSLCTLWCKDLLRSLLATAKSNPHHPTSYARITATKDETHRPLYDGT